jgi:hypothetical protein
MSEAMNSVWMRQLLNSNQLSMLGFLDLKCSKFYRRNEKVHECNKDCVASRTSGAKVDTIDEMLYQPETI